MKNGFDRLASPYRWMEYATFGRALERCRYAFLPQLSSATSALLLGYGDGRFAARLLQTAPEVRITAVDASAAMLQTLEARCRRSENVTTYCLDLASGSLDPLRTRCFDLVISHFFLDCLSGAEVERLLREVKPLLSDEARWIVSEFQVPQGILHVPSLILICALYAAFRVLTGLRVRRLPDYKPVFIEHGFTRVARHTLLGGLLVAEQWRLRCRD